jgi:hypothetical protein
MSIKTIGQQTKSSSIGLEKKINDGAKKLVIDILQATQYSTPIPSTIRELVTNACDSHREKEIAINILTGKNKVEDYFITREGEEYEDSNFDSSYYDLNWLDTEDKDVVIEYREDDEGTGYCDSVKIIDYGVGIGGRRLEGMLELGYSTKRNTSENFGAFGLGSKVALSTGVPFYTVETHYNGKKFLLNCHPYKTDFVISKWDADGAITLSNGEEAYYQVTNSKNKTIISFGVKKHNRRLFVDSVYQQLSYFENVKFFTYYHGSQFPLEREVSNKQLLNTESMIVSDGSYYSRPHIVIVKNVGDNIGINYGSIDFRELEMEELWGNVGIKCPIRQSYVEDGNEIVIQDGVEVTPSREKVIWSDNTRKYVQQMIEKAADEASQLIEEELVQDDFMEWVKTCSNILYHKKNVDEIKNAPAIAQISRLVDTSKIKPKFKDTEIRFTSPKSLLTGIRLRKVWSYGNDIKREDCNDWTLVNFNHLYFTNESVNKTKDLYLTSGSEPIFVLSDRALDAKEDLDRSIAVRKLVKSASLVKSYDDIEVPEDYIETVEKYVKEDELTNAQYRKLHNKIVAHTLRWGRLKHDWVWDKFEAKISEIVSSEVTTFYGTREDEVKIKTAALLISSRIGNYVSDYSSTNLDYQNSPVLIHEWAPEGYKNKHVFLERTYNSPQIICLAQSNIKHAETNENWRHIDEFFYSMDQDGNIVASEYLKVYLTAVRIAKKRSYDWMSNGVISYYFPELHKLYKDLRNYSRAAYTKTVTDTVKDYVNFLGKFIDYQDICDTGDVSLRQQKSSEIFVVDVPSIDSYHKDIVSAYSAIEDLAEGIDDFMRSCQINYLRSQDVKPVFDLIFNHYGKFDIDVPEISVPGITYTFETKDA